MIAYKTKTQLRHAVTESPKQDQNTAENFNKKDLELCRAEKKLLEERNETLSKKNCELTNENRELTAEKKKFWQGIENKLAEDFLDENEDQQLVDNLRVQNKALEEENQKLYELLSNFSTELYCANEFIVKLLETHAAEKETIKSKLDQLDVQQQTLAQKFTGMYGLYQGVKASILGLSGNKRALEEKTIASLELQNCPNLRFYNSDTQSQTEESKNDKMGQEQHIAININKQ
jgi:hypothetical protein